MTDRMRWLSLAGALAAIVAIIAVILVVVQPPQTVSVSPAPDEPTTPEAAPTVAQAAPATPEPAPTTPQVAAPAPVTAPPTPQAAATPEPTGPLAPEFVRVTQWLNGPALSLADLRGRVVLIDVWTFGCYNCRNTLPYLRDWHAKYASEGLQIVGVHTPEFEFEQVEANVREAMVRLNVTWPVAMDNDWGTWRAYNNRYWPRKYLVDQQGRIRYDVIGEGSYAEMEHRIRELLTAAGPRSTTSRWAAWTRAPRRRRQRCLPVTPGMRVGFWPWRAREKRRGSGCAAAGPWRPTACNRTRMEVRPPGTRRSSSRRAWRTFPRRRPPKRRCS